MNDDNLSVQDLGFLPENIETLFKVEPPVARIENGYGYLGVLLRDTKKDLLQCHVCGEWRRSLGQHVRAHGLTVRQYRIKFGLPLKFPLCSRELSNSISKRAINMIDNLGKKNMHIRLKKARQKRRENGYKSSSFIYGGNSAAHKNKFGTCDEQIDRRFLIVSDILGKQPTVPDIREYDAPLINAIISRYKTFNKYLTSKGYDINFHVSPKYEDDILISSLRKFFKKFNRIPSVRDYQKNSEGPHHSIIRRRFGSWNRALASAGLI